MIWWLWWTTFYIHNAPRFSATSTIQWKMAETHIYFVITATFIAIALYGCIQSIYKLLIRCTVNLRWNFSNYLEGQTTFSTNLFWLSFVQSNCTQINRQNWSMQFLWWSLIWSSTVIPFLVVCKNSYFFFSPSFHTWYSMYRKRILSILLTHGSSKMNTSDYNSANKSFFSTLKTRQWTLRFDTMST